MPSAPPFTAVLFDLDGTLVATDRFWPDAARAGALQAFTDLDLDRPLPSTADWMSMVGKPLADGFHDVFPDLPPDQRAHVQSRCVEAEHRLLADGRAGYLPGVPDTLAALRAANVRTGIASNCGRDYLASMMNDLGLAAHIDEARCLDSPGIANKADMIEDLLLTFGTRRAVFVGDRTTDRDAAWANGLPHVHLARGYAAAGEHVEAEATLEGIDELLPRLDVRREAVDALAAAHAPAPGRPLAITGAPGAGKTLLAAELAQRTGARLVGAPGPLDPAEAWILDGGDPPAEATVLELVADEAVLVRRLVGRDGRLGGPPALEAALERLSAWQDRPPTPGAHRIDASNALGPLPPAPLRV